MAVRKHSKLLTYLSTQYAEFNLQKPSLRLQSLYSDFSNLAPINTIGYDANMNYWRTVILDCNMRGLLRDPEYALAIGPDTIAYSFQLPKYGKPLALECVLIVKFPEKRESSAALQACITQFDKALIGIKTTCEALKIQVEDIQQQMEKLLKEYDINGNKKRNLYISKRRYHIQEILKSRLRSLETMEMILMKIESSHTDEQLIQTFNLGADTLRNILSAETLTVETVNSVTLEIQEALSDYKEVEEGLARGMDETLATQFPDIEEAELEGALKGLDELVIDQPKDQSMGDPTYAVPEKVDAQGKGSGQADTGKICGETANKNRDEKQPDHQTFLVEAPQQVSILGEEKPKKYQFAVLRSCPKYNQQRMLATTTVHLGHMSLNNCHGLNSYTVEKNELTKLIRDLKAKAAELKMQLKPIMQRMQDGEIKTNKGVSFLEVKYQIMIQYILQLAFYAHLKLCGKQVEGHPVIESLVESRVILDRMKPIESKLKYQIDKLVRTAVMGTRKTEQETTSTDAVANDPLAFKPNPMNLLSKEEDDEEEEDAEEDVKGVYRPPKLAPVSYDENTGKKSKREKDEARLREKASRSRLMKDLAAEMNDAPEEIDALGGVNEGFGYGDRIDNLIAEKDRYEEDNYVRLSVTRKEKQRLKARNKMRFESEFDNLNDFSNLAIIQDVEKQENERFQNVLSRKRRTKHGDDMNLNSAQGNKRARNEGVDGGYHGLIDGESNGRNKFKRDRAYASRSKGKKRS
ncbi:hypothetical protein EC973_009366 [Apophysomyces ossiformis]|uniref:Uncharacterized protein n=1 Tax=Apophysomyces ossiformis TaxID=679940 RepID=A0A8H7BV21_9FUNG|nr:hypothetical protein EC973_009366 [Apophysomyces ossiformis]